MSRRLVILFLVSFGLLLLAACCSTSPAKMPTQSPTPPTEKDEVKIPRRDGFTPLPPPSKQALPPQPGAFDFIDADHGWLAVGNPEWQPPDHTTIMITSDGGRTWTEIYESNIHIRAIDFVSQEHGWFTTDDRLFTTNDGGYTWLDTATDVGLAKITGLHFVDDSHGWIVSTTDMLATMDGGNIWQLRANPCPGRVVPGPRISFTDELNGWAICGGVPGAGNQNKWLFRTADGGHNWELFGASSLRSETPAAPGQIPTYGYVSDIAFVDAKGWMATTRGGLYSSKDGGITWDFLPTALYCGDWFTSNPQLLSPSVGYLIDSCGRRTVLFGTQDGGTRWSRLYPPPFLEACGTPESRMAPVLKSSCCQPFDATIPASNPC